jgi:hypothetical protein
MAFALLYLRPFSGLCAKIRRISIVTKKNGKNLLALVTSRLLLAPRHHPLFPQSPFGDTPFFALENNVFQHRKHRFLPKKTMF